MGQEGMFFPSGMLRDMGRWPRAYRLVMGQHAGRDDGVSIFDTGADVEPVSVQDQAEFHRHWLESPKSQPAAEQALGADSP
jgi:hypothetical protein